MWAAQVRSAVSLPTQSLSAGETARCLTVGVASDFKTDPHPSHQLPSLQALHVKKMPEAAWLPSSLRARCSLGLETGIHYLYFSPLRNIGSRSQELKLVRVKVPGKSDSPPRVWPCHKYLCYGKRNRGSPFRPLSSQPHNLSRCSDNLGGMCEFG